MTGPSQHKITIRAIAHGDNKTIATIIRAVLTEFGANKPGTVYFDPTTDDMFTLFATPGSHYFILEMDGQIAGGSGVFPTPGLPEGTCELVKLYLLPAARGRGNGKLLIETCIEKARELGYRQMYLETMPELQMAMSLYERCGFEYLKGPLGESGHFGCGLWMLKML